MSREQATTGTFLWKRVKTFKKGIGRLTKAGGFDQGEAGEGPEDIFRMKGEQNPGSDEFGRSRWEL